MSDKRRQGSFLQLFRRSYETGDAENVRAWRDSFGLEGESDIEESVKSPLPTRLASDRPLHESPIRHRRDVS
jgi:hypothetical protein